MADAEREKRTIKTSDGFFEVSADGCGGVYVSMYDSGGGHAEAFLCDREVKELCAALRMSLEEAQAALPEGPAFERDEYLRVVAMSAADAMRFMERDDEPDDLGPAEPSRYRAGARVWGFRCRKKK